MDNPSCPCTLKMKSFNHIISNSFPEPLTDQASFTGYRSVYGAKHFMCKIVDPLDFHIGNNPWDFMGFHGSFRSRLLGLSKVNQEIGRTILQPPESSTISFQKAWCHSKKWPGVICQIRELDSFGFLWSTNWQPFLRNRDVATSVYICSIVCSVTFRDIPGINLLISFKFASVLISKRTFRRLCPSGAGKAVCSAPARNMKIMEQMCKECIQNLLEQYCQ